ncbi:cytochrome o ubiquinol oxidase subunit IV [Agrobacterium vitis]|uniref:cytochrome o ubiquinol oxidase subunit IV n=1 Tax=Agrobacterium vitis TaxID=373 RepID=UPI0012E7EFF8|nr:cytochrome o ubiquinol oxidase subunit IV [Agrobacterium vitis]MVA25203.1 cytochrome o ubiquinol oxidase subunit IV [Agrobacterium vitis]
MNDKSHAHSHGHGHDHHHGGHEASHGSMKTYMIGFVLSVILTSIPFYLVMSGSLTNKALLAGIVMGLGAIQVVVHMIYFLHMNTKSEGGWNMMALIFTIIVVVIALSGSLWVMHHLNTNMMPMSPDMMRNVP